MKNETGLEVVTSGSSGYKASSEKTFISNALPVQV